MSTTTLTDAPRTLPTLALLQAGKLEQTCAICGRHEAAGARCTWCGRPTGAATWYLGSQAATEHPARLPATPPADPPGVPTEYRRTADTGKGGWPPAWGASPFGKPRKPARKAEKPPAGASGGLRDRDVAATA